MHNVYDEAKMEGVGGPRGLIGELDVGSSGGNRVLFSSHVLDMFLIDTPPPPPKTCHDTQFKTPWKKPSASQFLTFNRVPK